MNPREDERRQYHMRDVYNESGEEVPPFGVMMMIGIEVDTGRISIDKPNRDDLDPGMLLINGEDAIPIQGEGSGTQDGPMLVMYSPEGELPVAGGDLGTVAGEWSIAKDHIGFMYISDIEDDPEVVFASNRYRALVDVKCQNGSIIGELLELPAL